MFSKKSYVANNCNNCCTFTSFGQIMPGIRNYTTKICQDQPFRYVRCSKPWDAVTDLVEFSRCNTSSEIMEFFIIELRSASIYSFRQHLSAVRSSNVRQTFGNFLPISGGYTMKICQAFQLYSSSYCSLYSIGYIAGLR